MKMIKIENVNVCGWEAAIRGMRNPMNSWDKSDSGMCATMNCENCKYKFNPVICEDIDESEYIIGENDFTLMQSLVKAGSDHSKFMRMITVTFDITAPLYFWKEFDTYKVGTVRNSCSTMHKIHSKEFTPDDFSCEHLQDIPNGGAFKYSLEQIIAQLNYARDLFIETNDKTYWWQMIQLLPSSYNQRATIQLNYAVLRNMYHSRKNHKLDEWKDFCKWIESLPYSELITGDEVKERETE
jgi:hypothetical protein